VEEETVEEKKVEEERVEKIAICETSSQYQACVRLILAADKPTRRPRHRPPNHSKFMFYL
jgi:hypothetical protein